MFERDTEPEGEGIRKHYQLFMIGVGIGRVECKGAFSVIVRMELVME